MAAAPLARLALLRACRLAPPAARAASSLSSSLFSAQQQQPAILMMALDRAPLNLPLVFESRLELPVAELPALHQVAEDIECPSESLNGAV